MVFKTEKKLEDTMSDARNRLKTLVAVRSVFVKVLGGLEQSSATFKNALAKEI